MAEAFKIEEIHGCTVVYGSVPLDQISQLLGTGKGQFADSGASRALGATMVVGTIEDLDNLKKSAFYRAKAMEVAQREAGGARLSQEAINWLAMGERGMSSDFIFGYLGNIDLLKGSGCPVPYDSGDLRRCRLLVEQVPEFKGRIKEMASASPQWSLLVERWDEICSTMDAESPEWRDARGRSAMTNAMLRQIREQADAAR